MLVDRLGPNCHCIAVGGLITIESTVKVVKHYEEIGVISDYEMNDWMDGWMHSYFTYCNSFWFGAR